MPVDRFFLEQQFHEQKLVTLQDQEFHHLAHVTRAKAGNQIELVNGKGSLAIASVISLEKKQATLKIDEVSSQPKPKIEIILAQAIPRINRLDFILEKGTELGMTQLWLFPGDLSERKELTDHQLDRMHGITIAAMKQCGRLYLPEILIKNKLLEWEKTDFTEFFGDIEPSAQIFYQAWNQPEKGILFYIGPESGFSEKEQAFLRQRANGVKLHPNILRTDTAALVALALISHKSINYL